MNARLFWNERYSQPDYAYGIEPNDFLKDFLGVFPDKGRILCPGEGEGRNAVFLAKNGHEVCAVDFSSVGQEKALKLAEENRVSINYVVADINDFDFGEARWDAVVSIFAHTDPDTRRRTLQNALKALKTGGVFVLEAYHPKQIALRYGTGGPRDIEWLVSLEDLVPCFSGQQIIHQLETERTVHEGHAHSGKAFVTQFICRKVS